MIRVRALLSRKRWGERMVKTESVRWPSYPNYLEIQFPGHG